jgi:hypothetical protein
MPNVAPGFPKLDKQTRPWVCRKGDSICTRTHPCRSCLGARNRRSGREKQRQGRKAVEAVTGLPTGRFSSQTGNEETWRQPVLFEAKSGAQVGPIATRFLAAEAQAHAAKATGDARPFAMLAMPKGWGSDGLMLCRLSELSRVVEALVNQ